MTQLQQPLTAQQILNRAVAAANAAQQAANTALAALEAMQSQQGSGGGQSAGFATSVAIPYWYPFNITLDASANNSGTIQFAADSTFELLRIVGFSSADVPGNQFQNNFSARLQDGATGRYLSSVRVSQSAMCTSSYQYGNDEKYPIRFPANSIMNVDCLNLTLATLTITLFLKGYKFFQVAPASAGS